MNKHAILKYSTDDVSTDHVDLSFAVLSTAFPLAFVETAVSPEHLSISFFFVVYEIAFIEVAAWVVNLAIAFFKTLGVSSIVFCFASLPFTLAMT